VLGCQKGEFSLPNDLHYLNCAYMSPLPKRAEAHAIAAIEKSRVPSQYTPDDWFGVTDRIRHRFAELAHLPDPKRVAIIPSASYGIATVAANTPVSSNENIVIVEEQFPSNVYSWRRIAGAAGAELRTVGPPDSGDDRGMIWNRRVLESIDADTAVVALGPVHWSDGTRFDIETIGDRARDVGAAFIIDGTQAVGAMVFDARRVRPDALICASYKWLLGPYCIGVAYYGERYDGGLPIEDNWINREGSENFSAVASYVDTYQPGATRYDVGEKSHFILGPMLVAAIELLLEWGVDEIQAYCRELMCDVLGQAREQGYDVEDESWRAHHLVGIRTPPRVSLDRLQETLADRNVSVSLRGSAIRVSPHLYNDENDVAKLAEALQEAVT
jgi:selenocysteine lyase/cysteine desulfurase